VSAYLSQRFFLTAGDRPEVSQPTSNGRISVYRRSLWWFDYICSLIIHDAAGKPIAHLF